MKKFIVLMSHDMSELQKNDAYKNLEVDEIIEAPKKIKTIWANINPTSELDIDRLNDVILWIKGISQKQDYILVQGEFGATFYIVDYCFKNNLVPVYATSVRRVEETRNGNEVLTNRIFVHEGYRKYISYKK
ncbi:CRISPR-associated protein Csx20 [Intestinibacter sp.]